MVAKLKVFGINISFTFRHKWDKKSRSKSYSTEFRNYELGLWFSKNKVLSKIKRNNETKKLNLTSVNDYTIGVRLIVVKFWVSFNKGRLNLTT